MRIGMILDSSNEFPTDIRVEKEIKALTQDGHEVFVLSVKHKHESAASEFIPALGATIERVFLPDLKGKYISNTWRSLTMFDTRWLQPTRDFILRNKIEILHVHDLFTLPAVLKVARELGVPVISDLHENMPASMRAERSVFPLWKKMITGLVFNYRLMRWNEARALKKCAAIIVVVPEAAERILGYGIDADKIHIISNTEDETTFLFKPEQADHRIKEKYASNFVISYIGGLGVHRGLDTTLKAMPFLVKKIPNIKFLIVGADPSSKEAIDISVEKMKVGKHVEVLTWQPFHTVNSYVMASDICLVPHNDFEHTHTTIPHKLFQYMICGKPVLVSDCRPLKRIMEQSGGGMIFRANDERDLAEKAYEMSLHPGKLERMGQLGQNAALGIFSWKKDADKLRLLYKKMANEYSEYRALTQQNTQN